MIWRVILLWLAGVSLAIADLPRHGMSFPLTLPATVTFRYDANGNLTGDGTRSFYYDAENRLTNVQVTGQWRTGFLYDGLGWRRIREDYTWVGGSVWVLTNGARYICDGMVAIQKRDTNNNVLVTYTRGLDLSRRLQGAGGIGGLLARTDTNGTVFYHTDGSGNVTALIDTNGNVVARYEYDAYGRTIGIWGPLAAANVYRFSSKEYDAVTGLYYYGGRYYDPILQRWLNQDPIGEAGGINLYGFVGNEPIDCVDPSGLQGVITLTNGSTTIVYTGLDFSNAIASSPDGSVLRLFFPSHGSGVYQNLDQYSNSDSGIRLYPNNWDPPGVWVVQGTNSDANRVLLQTLLSNKLATSATIIYGGCHTADTNMSNNISSVTSTLFPGILVTGSVGTAYQYYPLPFKADYDAGTITYSNGVPISTNNLPTK